MHSSGDTLACLVSGGEWTLCLMCTFLVTQTVACLVSGGESAWLSMYIFLVKQTVICLVSDSELACFTVLCSGDSHCGLSCFRQ